MAAFRRFNLDTRIQLETSLNHGESLTHIAGEIDMTTSSVSREVKLHCIEKNTFGMGNQRNRCVHRFDCSQVAICPGMSGICKAKKCAHCGKQNCNQICKKYAEEHCDKLKNPPYVCNGCPTKSRCPLRKSVYSAKEADETATKLRSDSRSGFDLTEEQLAEIDATLSERLKKGQSIHHIFVSSQNIFQICEKTAYALVNSGCISARRIDLPRSIRMKPRKGKKKEVKVDKKCRENRTYDDYQAFMSTHPDLTVLQGDTVEGVKGGKCILTLTWTQFDFQIAFLRDHNDSASVTLIVNQLYENLGIELFGEVMPKVWLLDNGSEFSDPTEMEKFGVYVFYCDPSSPYQKGACENTHEEFRRICPKGTSMDDYVQEDIDLAFSHTNSLLRPKLNDHSPYEMFEFTYGKGIVEKYFHLMKIDPNDVVLKPFLLRDRVSARKKEAEL